MCVCSLAITLDSSHSAGARQSHNIDQFLTEFHSHSTSKLFYKPMQWDDSKWGPVWNIENQIKFASTALILMGDKITVNTE